MQAPDTIFKLVERFESNIDQYRSPRYNEAQLRNEFANPFFIALGWDVFNEKGYAEAYKEVVHEAVVKVGGATKAPDYSFRIGGTRKFFVETKKPAVNLSVDPLPAFQLRRYAWSAKLPLSILTDFEEFAVYDTRIKPAKNDKASLGRIINLTYKDYPDRWEEIADIFSPTAIRKGSFDKYVETTRKKKGTAEVDDAFLKDIESWRDELARNIALRNPGLSTRELNFAVQRIIDRIIFLRICEDRGIEEYGELSALLSPAPAPPEAGDIYSRLVALFNRADERYNSGLFHFNRERGRPQKPDTLTPTLKVDDRVPKEIIKDLYYPESPYEFSVLPADILGQVYEQFLGKVIRLTPGHRAVVEEKPEVKKAGGVYYTPTYIVDYIVENTVGKLLEGKTPRQVSKLRILDPACGSGSFLIGAYQKLLDWHQEWYFKDGPEKHRKELYESGPATSGAKGEGVYPANGGEVYPIKGGEVYPAKGGGGDWRLTTAERRRILLNNIYGVDIDPQAVEVTKLSLLLKVLEGESGEVLNRQLEIFRERALPDLATNIKCGNSLIGPDFYQGKQMSLLSDEERLRINAFDWNEEFKEIMDSGGFDAVIGNPPYGAYYSESEKQYFKDQYKNQSYQFDSYLLFMERSITKLLNDKGFYGMIIPNPWLTNVMQKSIRRLVTEKTRIIEIVHFKFPVFKKVTVDNEIVILQKTDPKEWKACIKIIPSYPYSISQDDKLVILEQVHNQDKWRKFNGDVINIFLGPEDESLAEKCVEKSVVLSNLFKINVGIKPYQKGKGKPTQTKETVEKRIYDSNKKEGENYRKYLRGKDINRYTISPKEIRYIKYGPWLAEPRPAADFDAPEKIFVRQTGDSIIATIDREKYICLNNMHVLVPKNYRYSISYVLGVLNSKLINWYYHTLNPEYGEALAEVKKTNVAKLPIRTIDFDHPEDVKRHDRMVALVEDMLELHKKLASARTDHSAKAGQRQIDATDRQIDNLVYELYGLNEEEIEIIEKNISNKHRGKKK